MSNLIRSILFLPLVACTSAGATYVDAVMTNAGDESLAELRTIISTSMNRDDVMLSPQVFTSESVIAVDRMVRQTLGGRIDDGRSSSVPITFRLVRSGTECLLIKSDTEAKFKLEHVQCRPLKN